MTSVMFFSFFFFSSYVSSFFFCFLGFLIPISSFFYHLVIGGYLVIGYLQFPVFHIDTYTRTLPYSMSQVGNHTWDR